METDHHRSSESVSLISLKKPMTGKATRMTPFETEKISNGTGGGDGDGGGGDGSNSDDMYYEKFRDEGGGERDGERRNIVATAATLKCVVSSSERVQESYCDKCFERTFLPMLPIFLRRHFFPPSIPSTVQLLRPSNIAIPMCYLSVGILQGLSGPLINVYPLLLAATEAQQTTISQIRSLPASFKLPFGFLSDNVPLCGYRRKSYMMLGWCLSSLSMLLLLTLSDLSRVVHTSNNDGGDDENDDDGEYNSGYDPSPNAPSIPLFGAALLLYGTGFWLADVMGDSIVAEKAKLEPISSRGHLQSTCYASRFFGLMVAYPLSTYLYSSPSYGPSFVVKLMAIVPLFNIPFIFMLGEKRNAYVASTKEQCFEIWSTVRSRAVWQPMGFVYLYNVLQIGNAAWTEFLRTVLHFGDVQLNAFGIVANILLYVGVLSYKHCLMNTSWRSVYVWCTLLNGVLSLLQLLLISGNTFGIDPYVFAMGDTVFADFIMGVQFLPTTIMMVHLCPPGSEGASYAMFTTVNNSAMGVANALSTKVLHIWDVSKETLMNGEYEGIMKLTILTSLVQMSGVLFVRLLPATKEELMDLGWRKSSSLSNEDNVEDGGNGTGGKRWRKDGSILGGTIFLVITFLSVAFAIIVGVGNVLFGGSS